MWQTSVIQTSIIRIFDCPGELNSLVAQSKNASCYSQNSIILHYPDLRLPGLSIIRTFDYPDYWAQLQLVRLMDYNVYFGDYKIKRNLLLTHEIHL